MQEGRESRKKRGSGLRTKDLGQDKRVLEESEVGGRRELKRRRGCGREVNHVQSGAKPQ